MDALAPTLAQPGPTPAAVDDFSRLALIVPAYNPEPRLLALVAAWQQTGFTLIVLVDDGSDAACRPLFDTLAATPGVELLRHAVNAGKGRALKTAFNHCLCQHPQLHGVVTADADGQHAPHDTAQVARALLASADYVLGVRHFPSDIPLRSRLGNIGTRWVVALLYGTRIADTQTGLRGIPMARLGRLMPLEGERYEYETSMLVAMLTGNAAIRQIPIDTIYIDGNRSSHFNPLLDSMRIYYVLLRFFASSLLTAGIDLLGFALALALLQQPLPALVFGRVCALATNFFFNKKFVFKHRKSSGLVFFRYCLLVLLLILLSYLLLREIHANFGIGILPAKILAESILFILSFSVQRAFVFADFSRDTERYGPSN